MFTACWIWKLLDAGLVRRETVDVLRLTAHYTICYACGAGVRRRRRRRRRRPRLMAVNAAEVDRREGPRRRTRIISAFYSNPIFSPDIPGEERGISTVLLAIKSNEIVRTTCKIDDSSIIPDIFNFL